ncbi:MAG: DUF1273 family protein [Eubacteriaceae bacterium]|nr:DUF1273 family protein [Eubacteriaceae bacterium]
MDSELHDHTCSFTGHRPSKLPWGDDERDPRALELKEKLRGYIRLLAEQKGVRRFISGMAPGIDMYAAEAVIELKKEIGGLILECAVPDGDFTGALSPSEKIRYCRIISGCDSVLFVCDPPRPDSDLERDRYLADSARYILAVYSGAEGGTAYTVNYAKKRGCSIIVIDPTNMKVYAAGGKQDV